MPKVNQIEKSLQARIRKLERDLEECRKNAFEPYLFCRGLGLSRLTREVQYLAKPVSLSPRQFAVLEYLMLRPGLVVSRQDLMAGLWAGKDVSENEAEVVISQLRKRLGPAGDLIVTLKGRGYTIQNEEAAA